METKREIKRERERERERGEIKTRGERDRESERERERERGKHQIHPIIRPLPIARRVFEVLGELSYVFSQPSSLLSTRGDIVRSRVSWPLGHVSLWSCFYSRHALS